MAVLIGLKGISVKEIECENIVEPSDIRRIIESKKAATTADSNGAINVWRDDDGFIRCESMAWLQLLEEKKYKTFSGAEKWVEKWLQKIV